MGLTISKLMARLIAKKEMRILMVRVEPVPWQRAVGRGEGRMLT